MLRKINAGQSVRGTILLGITFMVFSEARAQTNVSWGYAGNFGVDAKAGQENLRNKILAIQFAIKHGANIINYSGGGAEFSEPEFKALQEAERHGILVSAAAGNERSNADEKLYFPAAYPLTNILSVAALN